MSFVQLTYAWLQTISATILVLVFVGAYVYRIRLRHQVRVGALSPLDAKEKIDSITTAIGFVIGPIILFVMLAIIFPTFARWVINSFIPDTISAQNQFQKWVDRQISDNFAATSIGALLKAVQFGFAFMLLALGLAFKTVLKFIMGRGHFKRLLREQLAHGSLALAAHQQASGNLSAGSVSLRQGIHPSRRRDTLGGRIDRIPPE